MFVLAAPSAASIEAFLAAQAGEPLSYREVGCTRPGAAAPAGYRRDHHRVAIGSGDACFRAAEAALGSWTPFAQPWVRLVPSGAPQVPGTTVAVVVSHLGFHSLNACRVLFRHDEDGPLVRRGFSYGTLPAHAERGEERFLVEWDRATGEVSFDLLAYSRAAHPLARLGGPIARSFQLRFGRGAKEAMRRAVGSLAQGPARK